MAFRLSFNSVSFVLILVSFVFLLLATISSPVVKSFNLGHTSSHTYGVFGYCWNNNLDCFTGYPLQLSNVDDSTTNWLLLSSSRDTLAKIFIITPISLGFNFILLVLIFITHFGSRPIVLIGIVVNVLSLILTIISCVVTILAYYPNLGWTAWILIGSGAANIISLIALILTLTVANDNDDADSTFENEDFGRFTNYNRVDDKFNHIQTSTFKANSSLDDEFEYKPKESTGTTSTNTNTNTNTNANKNNFSNYNINNGGYNRPAGNNNNNNINNSPLGGIGGTSATGSSTGIIAGAGAAAGAAAAGAAVGTGAFPSGRPGSRIVPPSQRLAGSGSLTSNSSSYFNKPQTANDFTQNDAGANSYGYQPNQSASSVSGPGASNEVVGGGLPYPTGTPKVNYSKTEYDSSVFEHHPEVEGHKPFTELDDDDDDDDDLDVDEEEALVDNNRQSNTNGINDSDNDSDFTSVSQRAPNPQYYGNSYGGQGYYQQQQQQQQQNNQFTHVQQYTPMHQQHQISQQYRPMAPQQQYAPGPGYAGSNFSGVASSYYSNAGQGQGPVQPRPINQYQQQQLQQQQVPPLSSQQQRGPTVSENALDNNPDFQFNRAQPKRNVNPGFVPVASRYKNNPMGQKTQNASALMGRGGANATSGPYSITR